MSDRLAALTVLALRMHEGQVDKQGHPYSEHILAVTAAVSDWAKPVALFHDVFEDGRATRQDLRDAGLSWDELAAVHLLTRPAFFKYADHIEVLRSGTGLEFDLAREVKVADLRHNMGRLTPELESLRPRYEKALATLGATL